MSEGGTPVDANATVSIDLLVSAGTQTAFVERIMLVVFPVRRGRLTSRDDVVLQGQAEDSSGAIRRDAKTNGIATVDFAALPEAVDEVVVGMFIQPRPAVSRRVLSELDALRLTVRDETNGKDLSSTMSPSSNLGTGLAALIGSFKRSAPQAQWCWHDRLDDPESFNPGLDGLLLQYGSRF